MNTDVTGPGAALALGLLYLKTENRAVAGRLAVPATGYLLRQVRARWWRRGVGVCDGGGRPEAEGSCVSV